MKIQIAKIQYDGTYYLVHRDGNRVINPYDVSIKYWDSSAARGWRTKKLERYETIPDCMWYIAQTIQRVSEGGAIRR